MITIPQKRCKGCWSKQRQSWHPINEFSYHATYCNRCKEERKCDPKKLLNLLAQGLTNQEIADKIGITKKTVERRIEDIRANIGIHNRILLAFYALGKGLVTQDEIKAAIAREKRGNR